MKGSHSAPHGTPEARNRPGPTHVSPRAKGDPPWMAQDALAGRWRAPPSTNLRLQQRRNTQFNLLFVSEEGYILPGQGNLGRWIILYIMHKVGFIFLFFGGHENHRPNGPHHKWHGMLYSFRWWDPPPQVASHNKFQPH